MVHRWLLLFIVIVCLLLEILLIVAIIIALIKNNNSGNSSHERRGRQWRDNDDFFPPGGGGGTGHWRGGGDFWGGPRFSLWDYLILRNLFFQPGGGVGAPICMDPYGYGHAHRFGQRLPYDGAQGARVIQAPGAPYVYDPVGSNPSPSGAPPPPPPPDPSAPPLRGSAEDMAGQRGIKGLIEKAAFGIFSLVVGDGDPNEAFERERLVNMLAST